MSRPVDLSGRWLPRARRWAAWPHAGEHFKAPAPDCLLFHFTALKGERLTAQVLDRRRLAAHLFVGRDGKVVQFVALNRVAWHAGASEHGGRSSFNRCSIGVELDNAGALLRRRDGFFSINREPVPAAEAEAGIHRYGFTETYWHQFTGPQLQAVEEICRELVGRLGINVFLGHDDVAPSRKIDPGPLFPMETLRRRILGVPATGPGQVLPPAVHPRLHSYPGGGEGTQILRRPLAAEVEKTVVGEEKGWRRILFSLAGWVMNDAGSCTLLGDEAVVATGGAGFYAGPVAFPENLLTAPLPRGSVLRVLETIPGWLRVSARMSGWLAPPRQ